MKLDKKIRDLFKKQSNEETHYSNINETSVNLDSLDDINTNFKFSSKIIVFSENSNYRQKNLIKLFLSSGFDVIIESSSTILEKTGENLFKVSIESLKNINCDKYRYISSEENISIDYINKITNENGFKIIYDLVGNKYDNDLFNYIINLDCCYKMCSSEAILNEYDISEIFYEKFYISNGYNDGMFYKYNVLDSDNDIKGQYDKTICVYIDNYNVDVSLLKSISDSVKANIVLLTSNIEINNKIYNSIPNITLYDISDDFYHNKVINEADLILFLFKDSSYLSDNTVLYNCYATEKTVIANSKAYYDDFKNIVLTDNNKIINVITKYLKNNSLDSSIFYDKFNYKFSNNEKKLLKILNDEMNLRVLKNIITFKQSIPNIIVEHDIYNSVINLIDKDNYNIFCFSSCVDINNNIIDLEVMHNCLSNKSFIFISKDKFDLSEYKYARNLIYSENVNNDILDLLNSRDGIYLISNYEPVNKVSVKTKTFFNEYGTNYYSGGAERYIVDLHQILNEMGVSMDVYQLSKIPFIRKYGSVVVNGIDANDTLEFTKKYYYATKKNSPLSIYSSFVESYPFYNHPSIGISHGVFWDTKKNKYGIDNDYSFIYESALNCDKLISVDTNTANCFQIIDYQLGNKKTKVIPNYVDIDEFKYSEKTNNEKIVITYPRRLNEPRGMYLLLDIVDDLFKEFDNIEINFVGKGFDKDVNLIKEKVKKYPDKLFCYSIEPDRMHEVYDKSNIVLVPTLCSEGTSLSCLEAMSSGNIVICTRVGGLTDLIINDFNGYLIEPNSSALLDKIKYIINNIEKQDTIRKNAIEVAKVFNKNRWIESWKNELEEYVKNIKSNDLDLIEFYLNDYDNCSDELFSIIRDEIKQGNLVYIRTIEQNDNNFSCGLLQFVPYDEKIESIPKKIYAEKNINIERENVIYI